MRTVPGVDTIQFNRPFVNARDYGAVGGGAPTSAVDTAAIQAALADLPSTGGLVFIPTGQYHISSTCLIPFDNVAIEGDGLSTVLVQAVSLSGGTIGASEKSGITIRNMRLTASANRVIQLDCGDVVSRDILLEGLKIEQSDTGASDYGILLTRNTTGEWVDVTIRDVEVEFTGTGPSASDGIFIVATGDGSSGIVLDNVWCHGEFTNGFNSSTPSGGIEHNRVQNCRFEDAFMHGARFYHFGETQYENCLFRSNDAGAFFDNGSSNQESIVSNCKFIDNEIPFYTEEWSRGIIDSCTITGNTYGLWLAGGIKVIISDCNICNNDTWGINTDNDLEITTAAATYSVSHPDGLIDLVIEGCDVIENGEDGIIIAGVQRSTIIDGCSINRNGQSAGAADTSTFSAIRLIADTGTTTNRTVKISDCVLGNVGGSGGAAGKEQYGVRITGTSETIIENCLFYDLADALHSTNLDKFAKYNTFILCDDITWSGGTRTDFFGNTIWLGDLAGGIWDHQILGQMLTDQTGLKWTKYTVLATAFTAAATTESITLFSLIAGGIIHAVKIKHSVAFNDGGSATYTLSVGIAGTLDKYAAAFDVFQAVGATVFQLSTVVGSENHGAGTNILLTAVSDVNVGDVNAGSVDIWVLTSTAV